MYLARSTYPQFPALVDIVVRRVQLHCHQVARLPVGSAGLLDADAVATLHRLSVDLKLFAVLCTVVDTHAAMRASDWLGSIGLGLDALVYTVTASVG